MADRFGKDWDGPALADFVAHVEDALADSTVKFLIGRDKLSLNAGLRRVIFTTSKSPITAPQGTGGRRFEGAGTPRDPVQVPTPNPQRVTQIYSIDLNVTAHVYAENGQTVEELMEQLLVVMRDWGGGSGFKPMNLTWATDQGTNSMNRQPKMEIELVVRPAVTGERKPLTEITAQQIGDYYLET